MQEDLLRVTLVQSNLIWEDISANLKHFNQHLEGLKGKTDLIVLPEMFTTGFSMKGMEIAEPIPGTTFNWMLQHAQQTGAAVCGSIICEDSGQVYNRFLFVLPDGNHFAYDKKHLFTLAGEHEAYIAGTENIMIDYLGWKIRPLICYDLRFPVWSRNHDDYDLLLYVANWPNKRRNAWMSLLCARAIENQAYCIGVNRVGSDQKGLVYTGDSSAYDYSGALLTQLSFQESVVTIQIDKAPQNYFREKLNFLADRDEFIVK